MNVIVRFIYVKSLAQASVSQGRLALIPRASEFLHLPSLLAHTAPHACIPKSSYLPTYTLLTSQHAHLLPAAFVSDLHSLSVKSAIYATLSLALYVYAWFAFMLYPSNLKITYVRVCARFGVCMHTT